MKVGFFTMQDVTAVLGEADVASAKRQALTRVTDFAAAHPHVRLENITKASAAINRARTKEQLAMTLANFVLAHPSEGLKVI